MVIRISGIFRAEKQPSKNSLYTKLRVSRIRLIGLHSDCFCPLSPRSFPREAGKFGFGHNLSYRVQPTWKKLCYLRGTVNDHSDINAYFVRPFKLALHYNRITYLVLRFSSAQIQVASVPYPIHHPHGVTSQRRRSGTSTCRL